MIPLDLTNEIPSWPVFHKVGAKQRQEMYDSVGDILRNANKINGTAVVELDDWKLWIVREVFFSDFAYCDNCEEKYPELLIFNPTDPYDDEPSPESHALEEMGIEHACCASCIEASKEPRCENCGVQESWLAWRDDKSCSRWMGDEQVVFDEHSFISYEERQAQATEASE